jgi:cytochrome c553
VAVATVLLSAALGGACSEAAPFTLQPTGGAGGNANPGGGGAGGAFVDNGKQLFEELEADLVSACASCHESGGIADTPFLTPPDRYQAVLSWPGIVVSDPSTSTFLTWSVSGSGHSGTNLDGELKERVEEWLTAEAGAIEGPIEEDVPTLEPFTPIMGLNVVYLSPLVSDLEGVAIAFTASTLTDNTLKLDNLEVYTTAVTGVRIVHPVFGVYPKGKSPTADPADSFAGLDQRFDENTAAPLGVGTLLLTNWEPQAKLGLGFEVIEPYLAGGGTGGAGGAGGADGGCGDVTSFDTNARPALAASCAGCHGGNNAQATSAMDISDLGSDVAAACAQVKNRVNLGNPAGSQLFVSTDPGGNAAHPFKFGGNAGAFTTFRDDVTLWIESEAP